ncbi:MAG: pilus assembly protein PilC [Candidatus Edwardsbacteria bacterium RIFOXYD12_FULL_50_11]|uniref:Pilus assembly protein PilC n=1 Tax=Candidatus Edwardsbacteria bacterium GWF2_54_11 TaxID=1817851 RepID=A0A1F5R9R2_9BACT|nr:MAG: pilus assembly protein PilC [Candidatus Edwardsbacteria bacterium RifOxyC12_full_54_24]OGF08173.1 MAG: pilus assembly protein PilC [Candidatus Edwardsbacteria bacterium RifOxyA12_full_54_48]OGF11172.1 MAG: pilus assembly protein PilC [Candidatus Edwardsbacteria bacterium GWF2_54_11]OGF11470.1 MAG: pilus assembly protein PilC [Candidatus Edwardsbacteria bacterium GWE2_54_12]OGF14773.1 MAG: pilus assembly protein PilC [Candidatus Edwardsbacteria bacterium RIFOXYD12_FULL_50_11]OGJ17284.1 
MPLYLWKGRDSKAGLVSGELTAESEGAVIEALRKKNIIVSSVRIKPKELKLSFMQPKVSNKDLSIFTRQFATMINAGLPLVSCLEIQAQQQENPTFKKVLETIKTDVEGGSTLAEALNRQKNVFSELYINMAAAGEAGGILDNILMRLAIYLEKAEALVAKVKRAMIMPVILITVAVGAAAVLLIFVIPIFEKMFAGMGAKLPGPTLFVVGLSKFLQKFIIPIIIVATAAIIFLQRWYKTDKGQLYLDTLMLKIPILGNLQQKSAVARFARTLGTLLSSGVAILDALEITAKTAGNRVVQDAIMSARKSIGGGETISAPLKTMKIFPPMVVQMIAVGEATGGLDEMLNKIADFYDEEVDGAVEGLTAAMEPIIMVVLGLGIGGMVIAMYLPIFSMTSALMGGK